MIRLLAIASLLMGAFAACGGSQPSAQEPGASAATDAVLAIEAAKVTIQEGNDGARREHSMVLAATGEAYVDGRHVAVLKADGTVLNAAGDVVANITRDGALTFVGGREGMIISEEGVVTAGGRTVSLFTEDGSFRIPQSRLVGAYAGSARARRAMVVVFAVANLESRRGETEPPESAAPKPAEPAASPPSPATP